jgi:peptidylprolyl isomerase
MATMLKIPLSLLAVATAMLSAGCGSASHSKSTGAGAAAVPSTGPAPSTGTPSTGAAPAVANATNVHSKPQISAGTAPKPTQLVSKDLVVGTGQVAAASATVSVQYIGVNYDDGKEFDSSWANGGKPVDFPLSGVIPGFSQGIVGMKVGGRRELVIPPDLGYGPQGNGPVGPNETLVFVIDLVAVK